MVDNKCMYSTFMPSTLAHNLNNSVARTQKLHRHLQTGERLMESSDNPGDFAVKAKLNMRRANGDLMGANIQNTVSFLQVQHGMLKTVGTVLQRMAELKTQQDTIFATDDINDMYNYEFKELQGQLREISEAKFNGISLFSDQNPKVLFGDAIGTEPLTPESHESQKDNTMNLTRWGIESGLTVVENEGASGTSTGQDLLALAFTDESKSNWGYFNAYYENDGGWNGYDDDVMEFENFMKENDLDAKIGLIVTQQSPSKDKSWGGEADGGPALPSRETPGIDPSTQLLDEQANKPSFTEIFRGMGREEHFNNPPEGTTTAEQAQFIKNTFLKLTQDGKKLPKALGIFVDNSGSLRYRQIDQAIEEFQTWVKQDYPSVAMSSRSDAGWVNGTRMVPKEDWIGQSQAAIEDLMENDEDIRDGLGSSKVLTNTVYDLDDFDSSDFVVFIEKLTEAMAVNGAETSRATSELEDLNTRQLGLEKSMENIDGLDFSLAMTRYTTAQVETQFRAQLVSKAEDLHVRIADLLE